MTMLTAFRNTRSNFIICTMLMMGLLALVAHRAKIEHDAYDIQDGFEQAIHIGDRLRQTSDDLTRMVRTYVATGDRFYKDQFYQVLAIRDGKSTAFEDMDSSFWWRVTPSSPLPEETLKPEILLDQATPLPIRKPELELLNSAKFWSDKLAEHEVDAMTLFENATDENQKNMALQMLFDKQYHADKYQIMNALHLFNHRVRDDAKVAEESLHHALDVNAVATSVLAILLALALFALFKSVTEDRKREAVVRQALEKSSTEAEQAKRAKDEFLSIIGHELKTPLNSIKILGELIDQAQDLQHAKQDIKAFSHVGLSLSRLINRIVNLADNNDLRLEPHKDWADLNKLAANLNLSHTNTAKAANVLLTVNLSDFAKSSAVYSDAAWLEEMVDELISNAIDFAKEGHVTVGLDVQVTDGNHGQLIIQVNDDGPGISEEDKARIFDMFTQLDTSNTRKHQGLGLGLYIVNRLVNKLGGTITLTSTLGYGCAFTIKLPVALKQIENAPAAVPTGLFGQKILLVDDQAMTLKVTSRLLKGRGAEVTIADGGQRAIDTLADTENTFDCVLLDLQMPEIDGFAVLRWLRAQSHLKGLAVYAFTAGLTESREEHLRETGFDGLLLKPLDMDLLCDMQTKRKLAKFKLVG